MNDGEALELFVELSQGLTGDDELSTSLAQQYLDRIRSQFAEPLASLLSRYAQIRDDDDRIASIRDQIMGDAELGTVAQEIIMIWYMAGFQVAVEGEGTGDGPQEFQQIGPATPEQNFQALIWKTIRAHPLGLSGGYFGYWHYPPEN